MTSRMPKKVTMEQIRAETRAIQDALERSARNDPEWGVYLEGQPRPPPRPWWRRLLNV